MMNALGEVAAVVVITGAVAIGHWWVSGKPVPDSMAGGVAGVVVLKEGEVRLAELLKEGSDGLLWVDARSESEWRKNGIEGSVHVSTTSDLGIGEQLEREMERFFGASRVVIYCSDAGCGLSHEVAKRMAEYEDLVGGEIVVLHGGFKALEAAGMIVPKPGSAR